MKQHINAKVVVLDRIMYLLEEGSVSHLAENDAKFRNFVHGLYDTVYMHSRQLQASTI